MKKLIFTILIMGIATLLSAQSVVTLNLPNPCELGGIETNLNSDAFSIVAHPNPAVDFVSLSIETQEPIQKAVLQIIDVNGKCVLNEHFFSENTKCIRKMNISELKPGIYTILLQNEKGKASTKLIIN